MKAIYKQHRGFQHMGNVLQTSANNDRIELGDDTSTKKYPNNKYYQFNDEESSGRKYLKEKLNLEDKEKDEEEEKEKYPESTFLLEEHCRKEGKAAEDNPRSINKQQQISLLEQRYSRLKDPILIPKPKPRLSNKSASCYKYRIKKSSGCISTMQSQCQVKNKIIQSSRNHIQSTQNQLRYYKKLCVDIRKKNYELVKQLNQCRQGNRKSLNQLQKKVQKISMKYMGRKQNKQNGNHNKTDKIIESLRAIKGKLNKKQCMESRQEKKFYEFFIQSLGMLQQGKADPNTRYSLFEVQNIWKQILQFLIMHSYRIESSYKVKTIR